MRLNVLPVALLAAMTFGGAAFATTTATTAAATSTTTAATSTAAKPAVMAVAAPVTKTGTVKSINAKGMYVVLTDGWKYHLPKGFDVKDVKVGEKVSVTYKLIGKMHEVSSLTAAA